ncbi:MAG: sugar phosphate isomerase/epimerase family protein [Candidatus Helarchaeales archaeon]
MVELKISVLTDEFSNEFDAVCEHLQQLDFEYVELRNIWVGNVLVISDMLIEGAKEVLNECGLKVSALAGPLLKVLPPSLNPEPKEEFNYSENWKYNISLFDRALELAKLFDTKYIRIFGFNGEFHVPPVEQWNNFDIYLEWKNIVDDLAKKAANENKMLICENEGGLVKVLEQMVFIGKKHCGPGFGMLYDTANVANKMGMKGILTEEWLEKFAPCIQYVHAKGCKKSPSGSIMTCLVNDDGDICRWPRLVNYFKSMSPDDFIAPAPEPLFLSIETHMGKENQWENSTASLKNLQALV